MSKIGKIIRVSELPPIGERENNVIYQVAVPGAATYTDYAVDANGDLKTHAVVDGSIPLELADNHISISDSSLKAEGIDSQAEYNISTKEKLNSKLDKPSVDGNTQDYPKVLGVDDNGNTAALPAGDLGKNMMNSNLSNDSARNHILQAPFSINTLGNPYTITGLPNKNADFDNFRKVMVQNSNGLNAVIDGKTLIKEMPHTMTDAEVTAWKTAMNGGWTTNTMSVFLINPVLLLNIDREQYVTVLGTNLNFNPINFSVEICSENSTAIDYTVIKKIDNSKVQLNNSGLSLIFYENFSSYAKGKYKIRLSNGIASYITGVDFEIVDNLLPYDLTTLTWETKVIRDETIVDIASDSNGVYAKAKYTGINPTDWQSSSQLVVSASSSSFGTMADDFFLEFTAYADSEVFRNMFAGLTNEISPVLANNLFSAIAFNNSSTANNRMYVIKKGNFMTSIYKYPGGIITDVSTVSTSSAIPIKFKMCLIGTDLYEVKNNLLIKSAYKLN